MLLLKPRASSCEVAINTWEADDVEDAVDAEEEDADAVEDADADTVFEEEEDEPDVEKSLLVALIQNGTISNNASRSSRDEEGCGLFMVVLLRVLLAIVRLESMGVPSLYYCSQTRTCLLSSCSSSLASLGISLGIASCCAEGPFFYYKMDYLGFPLPSKCV